MKFVALFFALGVVVPLIGWLVTKYPKWRLFLAAYACFEAFNPLHINVISEEFYRGDARGIEITSVDILVLALLVSQYLQRRPPSARPKAFLFVRLLYLGAYLLSLFASPSLLRSFYSIWKLLRMYLAVSVFSTAFMDLEMVSAGLYGLGAAVICQGLLSVQQKYVYHMMQAKGSQPHANSLAMVCNLVGPTAFALLLDGRGKGFTVAVFAAASISVLFGLSRGGMMMLVFTVGFVVLLSFIRKVTKRKIYIVAGLVLAATIVIAKSLDTIVERFTKAPKESEIARHLFNDAAKAMADEHSFGIGINMYSHVLEHNGYGERAGILESSGDRNGIAHHIYWLTTAELGYGGCAIYLLMLATVLIAALRSTRIKGVRGDIAIGISAGMIVTFIQGTAEWIFRQTTMSYVFWILAAMIAAFRTWKTSNTD